MRRITMFQKTMKILSGKGLEKIPGAYPIYSFLYEKITRQGEAIFEIQGSKMYLDRQDKWFANALLSENHEKFEMEVIKGLIRKGMTVVDIGAHIGYYTLLAARLVGNNGKVYAFEPCPDNYKLLVKNIELNDLTNVTAEEKAVSDRTEYISLFLDERHTGTHSFSESNVPQRLRSIEVETVSLDDYFNRNENHGIIDLIKMDTQGAECLIVHGGRETVQKSLDNGDLKIVMEFWPYGQRNVGTDPGKLLQELGSYGFSFKHIDQEHEQLVPMDIDGILKKCKTPSIAPKGVWKGFDLRHVDLLVERI